MANTTAVLSRLPSAPGLEQARPRTLWRLLLWSVLLILTSLILAYPTDLRLEPYIVWSFDIFPNLPLFGVFFFSWTASLLVLLFTAGDDSRARWERLALVVLAALVFRGFWLSFGAVQHQGLVHLTETKLWLNAGKIFATRYYSDWPGLATSAALIAGVTGLDVYPTATLFTLFMTFLIAIGAYALLQRALKSSLDASLACLLILAGDQWLHISYWPWTMGLGLMLLFLSTVFARLERTRPSYILVELLLFVALTITHIFGGIFAFLATVAIWFVSKLQRGTQSETIQAATLMLYVVILAGWFIYWATVSFNALVRETGSQLIRMPLWELLTNTLVVGQAQVGEGTPQWAGITRLFWLAAIYVLPFLLWLLTLKRVRRLDSTRIGSVGAYLALVLLSLAVLVLITGGFGNIRRTITYGGFVSILVLFLFLQQFRPRVKKVALSGMATVLVFFSLPSFLGQALNTPSLIYYNSEFASGHWLQSLYGDGDGVNTFADAPEFWVLRFYLSHAKHRVVGSFLDLPDWNSPEVRRQMLPRLIDRYNGFSRDEGPAFFAQSLKSISYSGPIYSMPPNDPLWEEMASRLRRTNLQVYDNGGVTIYAKDR